MSNWLKIVLDITVTSTALASLIFMGIVFWVEVNGGRICYYEPNVWIALSELLVTAFSFGGVLGMFIRRLSK